MERENTASRFAYEWKQFHHFHLDEETVSMATWFHPRPLSDLHGLTVLDAGCGMGRHAVIAAHFGVSRLVGIDLGDAVDPAFENTRHLQSVCIVQGDIYYPPVKMHAFDAAYSIGVIHHLPDPSRGLRALLPSVRDGGWFHLWVYGRGESAWVVSLINFVRAVTARLPLPVVMVLAFLVTIPVVTASRSVYRVRYLADLLPCTQYMRWLATFSFRKVHAIVFDQLLAPVAYYLSEDQVHRLARVEGWSLTALEHSRRMSWSIGLQRQNTKPTAKLTIT